MNKTALAIHGGAGTITKKNMTPEKESAYRAALEKSLHQGWQALESGRSAIDAVEQAVCVLEDTPLFNAGKGSVFTAAETHEMDASIMCGKTLNAGSVAAVKKVKNPVSLARKVMEESEHVFLCGDGAMELARQMDIEFREDDYFFEQFRYEQLLAARKAGRVQLDHAENPRIGTVGAVALDRDGNLAAATSTGGMTNKKFGRIGDSAIIGAGTYADNATCAVSCTGDGEYFIRAVAAHEVSSLMAYQQLSLRDACAQVVFQKLIKIGGEGGLIAVDAQGNVSLPFNSEGMYRGWVDEAGKMRVEIYKE